MKRKILANVLTLCMLFSMIPMTAFAAAAEGLTVTVAAKESPVESNVTLTITDTNDGDLTSGTIYYKYADDDTGLPEADSSFDATGWTLYEEDETNNNMELTDAVNGQVVLAVYVEGTGTLTVKKGGVSNAIDDGTTPSTGKEIKSVTISGTAKVGETLTATVDPSDATVTYQWKADGTNISGADKQTYVPVAGDVGKTITVTVTGTDDYANKTATSTATEAVAAADPEPSEKTTVTLSASAITQDYNGKAVQNPTVVAKVEDNKEVAIPQTAYDFKWYDAIDTGKTTELKAAPVDAGKYVVAISLKADNTEYEATAIDVNVTINKLATKNLTGTAVLSTTVDETTTVDLSAILKAEDIEDTKASFIANAGDAKLKAEVTGATLTLTTLTGATKGEATVTVTAELTNYEDSTITITVTLTDLTILNITNTITGLTYTGEKAVIPEPKIEGKVAEKEPTITTTYKDADGKTVEADALINAGEYTVTYAVTEDDTYAAVTKEIPFTIAKATLTATGTKTATVEEGKALSTATLPDLVVKGVGETEIAGTWAWADPTTVLADDGDATVKFTPQDAAVYNNYEELTETIAVTVSSAPIIIKTVTSNITGVSVKVEDPVAADSESGTAAKNGKIILTGNMKEADGTYTISYTTNKSNDPVTETVLTIDEGRSTWVTTIVMSDGTYTYDVIHEKVTALPDNVDLKPVAPTVDASDGIKAKLGEDYVKNLSSAVSADASDILTNEVVNTLIPTKEEATALLTEDKVEVPAGSTSQFTEVHVVSYFDVAVSGYTPADSAPTAPAASLKLEITPMVKRMAAKPGVTPVYADFKNEADTAATEVENYAASEPIQFTVKLPTDFVSDTTDKLVTKHLVTPIEWIHTVVEGTSPDFVAKFNASTFSEYEIVADARTVTVTFNANGGTLEVGIENPATYTPDKIGSAFPTATPADDTKEFKGWAASATATSATYVDSLTDAYLTALDGAKDGNGKVDLYAVFGDKNTGDNNNSSGGGGGVSSNVTIDRPTNGKVTVTPTAPSKGATVTINLTPDTGYQVGTVTVTDKDGKAVELTKVDDTHYTFVMPDGKVTVKATFTKVDTPPATGFTDVDSNAYYADAVKWAVENNITNGLTATTFGPNNSCTRGQMVTFLWRAAGSPAATGTNSFADVDSSAYYYNAVLWAVEKNITNGTTSTTFSPNATVNRGQTVTFLYRYAESPAATGDTSFTDVTADAYYADAVKWAVAEGITNGTSDTTFAPASNCTRGQIVTFLYRQIAE